LRSEDADGHTQYLDHATNSRRPDLVAAATANHGHEVVENVVRVCLAEAQSSGRRPYVQTTVAAFAPRHASRMDREWASDELHKVVSTMANETSISG
jgi:hypothetical protein